MLGKALTTAAAGNAGGEVLGVEDVFSTYLYTGTNDTQTFINGIDLAGEGGLVWLKSRSQGSPYKHYLYDSERGRNSLTTVNTNGNEAPGPAGKDLASFDSTGFTVGTPYAHNINQVGETFVSWTFRKQAKFFDVVTYTGNGSNRTIAHNLGSVPGCIIVKRTDNVGDWRVYHRANTAAPETDYLVLDSTAATADSDTSWNDTLPTSTVFSLGTDATVNASGGTYVAYLFAHDAGGFGDSGNDSVVKCGSFTTDGSGNATVDLGWEPQWGLFKNSGGAANWMMFDVMRGAPVGGDGAYLQPNTSNAEFNIGSGVGYMCPTATGFQAKNLGGVYTFIYIAIRRGPMKTPTDATKVFEAAAYTGSGANPRTIGALSVTDLAVNMTRSAAGDVPVWIDRLRGGERYLDSSATSAEAGGLTGWKLEQTGQIINSIRNTSATTYVDWLFRRAPSFFDVVAYSGTGANRTVNHNLGVAPELIITKVRSAAGYWWAVYAASLGATNFLLLNSDAGGLGADSTYWNNTAPTASVFSVGANSRTNLNGGTLIAYLFATCPGVSKVGSYTGTGTTLNIDCGFAAGARFVLIKRTDSTGSWYIWDSARGIISGNDPYLLLNSTAAEVTNTDYIDPYSPGFEISSTAPAEINANGGSYIFLAVA